MVTVESMVSDLGNLKVSDLVRLKDRLETEWGVSARQQAVTVQPAEQFETPEPVAAQTEFDVRLTEIGLQKVSVIKVVRELVPMLSLVLAKAMVESAPTTVLESIAQDKANDAADRLRAVGATVEIQ